TAEQDRGPSVSVLYVEDNPSNIKLVERILGLRAQVELLVATGGREGLEMAVERRPALVLLDLNLPDMSGEEVLRGIRRDERTASTAVIMVSADATPGQIARLRGAGADDYLTKPFEIDEFLAVVDRETVRRVSHGWAGASSMIGARLLAALLSKIEAGGGVPDADGVELVQRAYRDAADALARALA